MNLQVTDLPWDRIDRLIGMAYEEDLKNIGDITVQGIFNNEQGKGIIRAKQKGIVSGLYLIPRILNQFQSGIEVTYHSTDSKEIETDALLVTLEGPYRSILIIERTILNFLSFLSGIATQTNTFVSILAQQGKTQLLDTRKTLPGYRELSKLAVVHGGGTNHRLGLYDMVMIKDNHADAAGGITKALKSIRDIYGTTYPIEVECRNLIQVEEALLLKPERIMLDNMNPEDCKHAVTLRNNIHRKTELEASGDMNEEKIALYGTLGLDFISVGKITHSAPGFNYSLTITQIS